MKSASREGSKLASILSDLVESPDRETFAKARGVPLAGGKVKVFVYFRPSTSDAEKAKVFEKYRSTVEKATDGVARAYVPVDALVPFSEEEPVAFVDIPDRPTKH